MEINTKQISTTLPLQTRRETLTPLPALVTRSWVLGQAAPVRAGEEGRTNRADLWSRYPKASSKRL